MLAWRDLIGALVGASLLCAGCSAIVNPEDGRLGGGTDGGDRDGGADAGDGTVPPGDSTVPPGDSTVPPVDSTVPPVDSTVPPTCETALRCDGDDLVACEDGVDERTPCDLGCSEEDGTPHCAEMIPSNVGPELWLAGAEDVTVEAELLFDTTDCDPTMTEATVVPQADGPELCVLSVGTFRIGAGGSLQVFGRRPLVIMATGEVRIEGDLDVSALGASPGAGGFRGGLTRSAAEIDGAGPFAGSAGAHEGSFDDGGGGAGGFCGAGGAGGQGRAAAGGAGGGTVAAAWELSPLFGGSGGGRGRGTITDRGSNAGPGGAGGGAVQISTPDRIRVSGRILAGGGGGLPGRDIFFSGGNWGSGGGGGSGGAILLEAPEVRFDGGGSVLAAGGAGGGSAGRAREGEAGEDGREITGGRASGGVGDDTHGADGGGGSAAGDPAGEVGGENLGDYGNGGGGGAGAGCVLVRTADATTMGGPTLHPSVAPGYRELVVLTR